MAINYDVVVLGGGTGGYVAAIQAAKNGQQVAVVEKAKLGGTCLHKGCIPTKALLRSAEVFQTVKKAEVFGVEGAGLKSSTLNFIKVQERKQTIVNQLELGIHGLFKQGKIDLYQGEGTILGTSIFEPKAGTVSVPIDGQEDNEMLVPKHLIIATGSKPKPLPDLPFDEVSVLSSDGMLALSELPQSIIIVGGGVIGMEWASMLRDFGVDVIVLEYLDQVIPNEDREISRELLRNFKKKKIKVYTGAKVLGESLVRDEGLLTIEARIKGKTQSFTAEKIMVSVGRKANIDGIGLANTKIETEQGFIKVNQMYQTKEPHIYAIGDIIATAQLAHVAMHEGLIAADHLSGQAVTPLVYEDIATCVYTSPEIASVGISEETAKERGFEIKTGKFNFRANGKALVYGEADGFVKVIADKVTNDLLGVSIIGPHATDLISEAALARFLDGTAWEMGKTIHPHPTLSEALGEAALAVDGLGLHGW